LSLSWKRGAVLAALSILAVSLLVAGVFLAIPNGVSTSKQVVAGFVLGTLDEVQASARSLSGSASVIFIEGVKLQVDLSNGTSLTFWDFGCSSLDSWPNFSMPRCDGGLNSTDIIGIHLDLLPTLCIGSEGSPIITVLLTGNYTVHSDLMDSTVVDLGVLNVSQWQDGGVASTEDQPPFLGRNYLTYNGAPQWTCTGFWNDYRGFPQDFPPAWQIKSDQIQSILVNGSDPAVINFNMDIGFSVESRSMTSSTNVTSVETGTTHWSGTWGTLQLLHKDDTLVGLTYNFTNINLDALLTK